MSEALTPPPAKLAYTVTEAIALLPWRKTKVNELIASGEIPSRFKHSRRYILHEDLVRYLQSEPVSQPSAEEDQRAANCA